MAVPTNHSNKALEQPHQQPTSDQHLQPQAQMVPQTPPQAVQSTSPCKPEEPSRLDMDLSSEENGKLSSSPPGSYTRIPPRSIDASAVPPILPPHLLQVILNQPDKVNATILPAPNHVMLNHLYALSIKDGIMVLSATHRFRKKYVTTLLYKPI